jgi:hypothetical protein
MDDEVSDEIRDLSRWEIDGRQIEVRLLPDLGVGARSLPSGLGTPCSAGWRGVRHGLSCVASGPRWRAVPGCGTPTAGGLHEHRCHTVRNDGTDDRAVLLWLTAPMT